MQRRLMLLFIIVLLAFFGLSYRLYAINRDKGLSYKKQAMSQLSSDAKVLPFRRGEIQDRKGSKLAYSEKVYNLVIDAKLMNSDDGEHLNVTLDSLRNCFPQLDMDKITDYVREKPSSRYKVFAEGKKLTADQIEPFQEIMKNGVEVEQSASFKSASEDGEVENNILTVAGVWFEEDYKRKYPYNSLACDLLGFVQGNNAGFFGIEEYYNNVLNGTNGRQYGYMNEDSMIEQTIKPAIDGHSLVTTIDTNIQSIIEKHIKEFYDAYKDNYREGAAADNVGVIVMNPNNGEIYGMAGYPVFDLNNPREMEGVDLSPYLEKIQRAEAAAASRNAALSANEAGMTGTQEAEVPPPAADSAGTSGEGTVSADAAASSSVSEGQLSVSPLSVNQLPESTPVKEAPPPEPEEDKDPRMQAMNEIWRNFCISDSYEPGSVMKPFTVAGALDAGKISGDESYMCGGYLEVGGHRIHCHNRLGDGLLTVEQGVAKSCNVVLMDIAFAMGKEEWLRYNRIFNFGLKTNVDLAGETNASELIFGADMTNTDLAVASFGQGQNVTMIQMAAGFSALVNGGYYYQPHVVSQVLNAEGAVIEDRGARVLKQVISEETSEKMRQYLRAVCMSERSECTGWSARPAGYTEGGKTGTAEKVPRSAKNYLISFMGFVPVENPQVLCYVVIDRPNVQYQSESTRLATVLNKDIMTEVLPYLNIFPTEPIGDAERKELEEKQIDFATGSDGISSNSASMNSASMNDVSSNAVNGNPAGEDGSDSGTIRVDSAGRVISENKIKYDEATGYPIDPSTGQVLNPITLQPLDGDTSLLGGVGE